MNHYPIIVVGAGHAGIEAALASSRLGVKTLLLTLNLDRIGWMSCNPAVGGIGKGHLVKEVDALGGEMAKNIDATGIQFRRLNTKKGPAVQATRVQADKVQYAKRMKAVVEAQPNLDVKQGSIESIRFKNGKIKSVTTQIGEIFETDTVVVTTGTFLKGLIHVGDVRTPAGREGDQPSIGLADCFSELFKMGRLKTGTPPRLNAKSIHFDQLIAQPGDPEPTPFSFSTDVITQQQVPCYITYTNSKTHDIIKENIHRSAMYSGHITGTGPRYCPSIEDKVVRFADKERHQIFLEPEGLSTQEIYVNGVSTSLPVDIQKRFINSIKGLEDAAIMRYGYAIEYDYVEPTQLKETLETKAIEGLFLAGQINGTTGYEEAAAQGLMAGINAALRFQNKNPLILKRHEAYIGVLIDDLITKGTQEPYRMFTSRAEYRLLLREDNADLRLREKGYECGLISDKAFKAFCEKRDKIEYWKNQLQAKKVTPSKEINGMLAKRGMSPLVKQVPVAQVLKRLDVSFETLVDLGWIETEENKTVIEQVEIQTKYAGYIDRQEEQVRKQKGLENTAIPEKLNFKEVSGLSLEVIEKLTHIRPKTIAQAERISGMTPGAITCLMVGIKKYGKGDVSRETT